MEPEESKGWLGYTKTTRKSRENPKEIIRPLILDMGIINPETKTSFQSDMLVDSGAVQTLVDWQIGAVLGIDLEKCPEQDVIGIAGETKGRACIVRMIFPGETKEHYLEAVFVKNVLGRAGLLGAEFFEQFYVEFEQYNNRFRISEKKELNWIQDKK